MTKSQTAVAREKVLSRYPTAVAVKTNISNWGVFVAHGNRWLSYGKHRDYIAWREAARNIFGTVDRTGKV